MTNNNNTLQKPEALMARLMGAVKALSELVNLLLIDDQLDEISKQIKEVADPTTEGDQKAPSREEALSRLAEITTTRNKDGHEEFLLHRLTDDFEYEKSSNNNQYTTSKNTYWSPEQGVAELKQDRSEATLKGANPVVSCWIPASSIEGVGGAQDNTGTWDGLGENPHKNKYSIIVKPGKFEIYQEKRQ